MQDVSPRPAVQPRSRGIDEDLAHSIARVAPEVDWSQAESLIAEIQDLKRQRNAVILAHNYQRPEVFHTIADITGDSLALAREASRMEADVIVVCGVSFMAETAKVLSPERTVLIPDANAGCSLAESITGEDVRRLRRRHPGAPVVAYVNTTAEVKAEVDVCCTSANAIEVVESLGADRVVFLPDRLLGEWVAANTDVELVLWDGRCEVHEQFTAELVSRLRDGRSDLRVLAHPECPIQVLRAADVVGSTSRMASAVENEPNGRLALVTDGEMARNLAVGHPGVEIVGTGVTCPHMQLITLDKVAASLREMRDVVEIDPDRVERARASVERMLEIGRGRDR